MAQDKWPYKSRPQLELKYNVCTGKNLLEVHKKTLKKYYTVPPIGQPDPTMLLRPFWSTWAQYHEDVNQSAVLDYAHRLVKEGFTLNSHIEIDDDWETCYGNHEFNPVKFPNVTGNILLKCKSRLGLGYKKKQGPLMCQFSKDIFFAFFSSKKTEFSFSFSLLPAGWKQRLNPTMLLF